MREIKFRAWEKELKEIIPVYNIDFQSKLINRGSVWRFFHEVELMQSTGLKDKNGVEIYEGDVVKGKYWEKGKEYIFVGQVKYLKPSFIVVGIKKYKGMHYDLHCLCKVMGNIYENKELLEDK